jgi:hypothetical protein
MKLFEEIEFWQYKIILKNFKEGENGRRKER